MPSLTKAQKVKAYWKLSSTYRGRIDGCFTFRQATKIVNEILASEHPMSKLRALTISMHSEMIEGTPSVPKAPITIYPN